MSRTKDRGNSEVEHLRGEIRRLKKQLRQFEKVYSNRSPVDKNIKESIIPEEYDDRPLCLSDACGKGRYNLFEILGRVFGTCDVCGERRKLMG